MAVLTRKEILKVYRQGPDAMVAFVLERDAIRERQVEALTARVAILEAQLRAVLGKDSHNSNKPPSTDQDRAGRTPKSLRTKSGKQQGGQIGHAGRTLSRRASPDLVAVHAPESCDGCGHLFSTGELAEQIGADRRQVFELPPTALVCTEHRLASRACPDCGAVSRGSFPPEARTSVQYGPGLLALGVSLTAGYLLPVQRAASLLSAIAGRTISPATIMSAEGRVAEAIRPSTERIHDLLTVAPVVHFDETGFFTDAIRKWLHVACTKTLTEYVQHSKRGALAHADIGILPSYDGTAVHDGYASYFKHIGCRHALCGVHLLRELAFLFEEFGFVWARRLTRLLSAMKRACDKARSLGHRSLAKGALHRYRRRYSEIVAAAIESQPPPARTGSRGPVRSTPAGRLLNRLSRDKGAFLRFIDDLAVPFDNSEAERDIRMMKVEQKVSGGFRTETGANTFCVLRSYLITARKQGFGALESLQMALAGQPFMPLPE